MIKVFVQKFGDLDVRFEQAKDRIGDSGFDLMACIGLEREIPPGQRFTIPTSIFVSVPRGIEAQIRGRSGLTRNFGVSPLLGTVDSNYRGEIKVNVFNLGDKPYTVIPGERIAQLVFCPVYPWAANLTPYDVEMEYVDSLKKLGETARGASGFGSSGR